MKSPNKKQKKVQFEAEELHQKLMPQLEALLAAVGHEVSRQFGNPAWRGGDVSFEALLQDVVTPIP
eukprot:3487229-Amphidinium_carterae.1